MNILETKQEISYWWRRDDQEDINESHIEALEEDAEARINEMRTDGYTSGELTTSVRMDDEDGEDGEDGVAYSGWWELTTIHPDTHEEKVKAMAPELLEALQGLVKWTETTAMYHLKDSELLPKGFEKWKQVINKAGA